MRVQTDNESQRSNLTPSRSTELGQQRGNIAPAAIAGARTPAPAPAPDRIERRETLADWAKNEWSTLASAAHGLASAPGVVSHAWLDAAKTNSRLGAAIHDTLEHWSERPASGRQVAIDGLREKAGTLSRTGHEIAGELAQANRLPLSIETSVAEAAKTMPSGARHAMEDLAQHPTAELAKLPAAVETHARGAMRDFESVARAQRAEASRLVPSVSRAIGMSVRTAEHVPGLKEIPVAGLLVAAAATAWDVRSGISLADAATANIASTIVGTAVGVGMSQALTLAGGASIADSAAVAAGAVAATGPVGWAVAGGVIGGAAAGYGVYKAIESRPGQEIVDGISHADGATIRRGVNDAKAATVEFGRQIAAAVPQLWNGLR